MLTFPTAQFPPQSMLWRLARASVSGGVALSGATQLGEFSAGGRWEAQFDKSTLWTRPNLKTWEAIAAMMDGGAMPFVVPMSNRNLGPWANPNRAPGDPFDDDTVFADGALWTDSGITATLTGSAALRATIISFNYAGDDNPSGGEPFTIWHASGAQRLYRIGLVTGIEAGVVTAKIRPPLREPCTAATPLDFDNPRCQMHVVGDMAAQVQLLRLGEGTVKFEEDFQPYINFAPG